MTKTKAYYFISSDFSEEAVYPLIFIDETGKALKPSNKCRIDELGQTIKDYTLTVIIPDQLTTLHHITLSLLNDKKAQAAIPYALEDYSAQEISELHFSYDKNFYKNGQYLVISCDKAWLQNLMAFLQKYQIEPKEITTAWFALSDNECMVYNQSMLFNCNALNGIIPLSMWPMIREHFFSNDGLTVLQFPEEPLTDIPKELSDKTTNITMPLEVWVSERINQSEYISLNQGAFSPKQAPTTLKKCLWLVGGSVGMWLVIWLTTSLLSLHDINQEIKQVDDKIASIYRHFFPGAKHIISPRFRISQKIKSLGANNKTELLLLLDQLATPLNSNHITPTQLSYKNHRLTLKLEANDYGQLEKFMNDLKKVSENAKQLNANRNENKVEATVEIQL